MRRGSWIPGARSGAGEMLRFAIVSLLVSRGVIGAALSVSNTLGDGMVLQRAPAAAVVWGFASPGVAVTTTLGGSVMASKADAEGVWRQALPPQPARHAARPAPPARFQPQQEVPHTGRASPQWDRSVCAAPPPMRGVTSAEAVVRSPRVRPPARREGQACWVRPAWPCCV